MKRITQTFLALVIAFFRNNNEEIISTNEMMKRIL